MIKLTRSRNEVDIPASFKGARLLGKAKLLVETYFSAKIAAKPMEFSSAQWRPAKDQLKKETHGKCAYCEAPTSTVAHGDVEHFRPKSIYWWLAFCYDNYLFSCQICNQTYKSNHFPVAGNQLQNPPMPHDLPDGADLDELIARVTLDTLAIDDNHLTALWEPELPALVNPYLEDPEILFSWEIDPANEEVWIRSAGSDRANLALSASEKFLGLNREELRRERFSCLRPLQAFAEVLTLPHLPVAASVLAREEIAKMTKAEEAFAAMKRFFISQWSQAIVD